MISESYQAKLSQAFSLALRLHAGQTRKTSGTPYLAHLMAVAAITMEHGGDEDEVTAALLHDAVEDAGGRPTLDLIRQQFGAKVADIVEGCTDADTIPKPPWRQRKETYIAHLASASASVRLVSAADKLHNVRTTLVDYRALGLALWERFRGGREGTLWYYRALAEALVRAGRTPLIEELERAVTELNQEVAAKEGGHV
jgi:(p)ppGpp synthase/HD superfamily hydrolase